MVLNHFSVQKPLTFTSTYPKGLSNPASQPVLESFWAPVDSRPACNAQRTCIHSITGVHSDIWRCSLLATFLSVLNIPISLNRCSPTLSEQEAFIIPFILGSFYVSSDCPTHIVCSWQDEMRRSWRTPCLAYSLNVSFLAARPASAQQPEACRERVLQYSYTDREKYSTYVALLLFGWMFSWVLSFKFWKWRALW